MPSRLSQRVTKAYFSGSGARKCYYCGARADTMDHVIPKVILEQVRLTTDSKMREAFLRNNRVTQVSSCLECNTLLSTSYFDSIGERKAALKKKLYRRYKKILEMPDWDDSDFKGMAVSLRNYILGRLLLRDFIRDRLR